MKNIEEYLGGNENGLWIDPGNRFLELNNYLKTLDLYLYDKKVEDKEGMIFLYKTPKGLARHNYIFEDYNKLYKHKINDWNHMNWEHIRTEFLGEDYSIDDIMSNLDKIANNI